MASVRQVEIIGLQDFQRELAKTRRKFPELLAKADHHAAEVVASEARRRAPRGPHQGGGDVAPITSSIQAGVGAHGGYVQIGGGASPHAVPTEFGGTVPRRGASRSAVATAQARHRSFASSGIAPRTRIRRQAYLYPAIAATRLDVELIYLDAIDRAVKGAFPGAIVAVQVPA